MVSARRRRSRPVVLPEVLGEVQRSTPGPKRRSRFGSVPGDRAGDGTPVGLAAVPCWSRESLPSPTPPVLSSPVTPRRSSCARAPLERPRRVINPYAAFWAGRSRCPRSALTKFVVADARPRRLPRPRLYESTVCDSVELPVVAAAPRRTVRRGSSDSGCRARRSGSLGRAVKQTNPSWSPFGDVPAGTVSCFRCQAGFRRAHCPRSPSACPGRRSFSACHGGALAGVGRRLRVTFLLRRFRARPRGRQQHRLRFAADFSVFRPLYRVLPYGIVPSDVNNNLSEVLLLFFCGPNAPARWQPPLTGGPHVLGGGR